LAHREIISLMTKEKDFEKPSEVFSWQGQKDLKKIRDFQLKTIIEKHRKNGD
jgi:hypothetical protein